MLRMEEKEQEFMEHISKLRKKAGRRRLTAQRPEAIGPEPWEQKEEAEKEEAAHQERVAKALAKGEKPPIRHRKPSLQPALRSLKRPLQKEQANHDPRAEFIALVEQGYTYKRAMIISGICVVEAATLLDKALKQSREGVTAYLIAEEHLLSAMKCLSELMTDEDPKIRLMSSAKLADTSYKILNNRTFIDRSKRMAEASIEKIRQMNNTWDAEFEQHIEREKEQHVRGPDARKPTLENSLFEQDHCE